MRRRETLSPQPPMKRLGTIKGTVTTSRSIGRHSANRTGWSRRVARAFCRNSVLAALVAVASLASGIFLFAQHTSTGTATMAVSVVPEVKVTTDGTNAIVSIRIDTEQPGSIWGDSACNTPIGAAAPINSSGKFTYALATEVPFTSSNSLICEYDPAAATPLASTPWPHTPASLKFSTHPSDTASGASISPAVTVKVLDSNGLVDTADNSTVTIAISSGGVFSSGATLTATASAGVATFSNLVPTGSGSFTLS